MDATTPQSQLQFANDKITQKQKGDKKKEDNLLLFLLALITGKSLQLLLVFGFLLPLARRHDYGYEGGPGRTLVEQRDNFRWKWESIWFNRGQRVAQGWDRLLC